MGFSRPTGWVCPRCNRPIKFGDEVLEVAWAVEDERGSPILPYRPVHIECLFTQEALCESS